jgi:hypothetical protein
MIEFLVAYLLWEGNASVEWWVLFVAIAILKLGYAWYQFKSVEMANSEADRVVKKLFEERK